MTKLEFPLSKYIRKVKLSALSLHPVLEPFVSILIAQNPTLLKPAVAKRAATYALSSQILFVTKAESGEQLITGPLVAWLSIARGIASSESVGCVRDPNPDPANIEARGISEALLLLATWPKSKTLEIDAAQIINGLPGAVRRNALGLQTRSTIELAAALQTSRFKLGHSRGPKQAALKSPLGFNLDDLIDEEEVNADGT